MSVYPNLVPAVWLGGQGSVQLWGRRVGGCDRRVCGNVKVLSGTAALAVRYVPGGKRALVSSKRRYTKILPGK